MFADGWATDLRLHGQLGRRDSAWTPLSVAMSLLVVALSIDGPACRRIFFEGADAVGAGAVCVQWREEIYRKRQRAARRRNRIIAVFSSLSSSMATECEPGRLQFILASLSAACCLW